MISGVNDDSLFKEAMEAYKVRNYHFARRSFYRLRGKNPTEKKYQLWLAKTLAHYPEKVDEAENILLRLRRTSFFSPATIEIGHVETIRGNYKAADTYFAELLGNPYSDSRAKYELGKLNERFRNFEIAKEYFFSLLESEDRHISLLELIYIEIQEGNYKRAFEYYLSLISEKNCCRRDALKKIESFLKYKLGKLDKLSLLDPNYFLKQLADYSEEIAIKNMSNDNESRFLEGIDLLTVFRAASGEVKITNPDFFDTISKFIFRFPSPIGVSHKDRTNAILVATFPGSTEIISVKPIVTGEKAKILTRTQ